MLKNIFKMLIITILFGGLMACTMPSSIEIKMQPDVTLPIGPDNGNLSEVLMGFINKALENAKKNGDVKTANYKDYKVKNKAGNLVDVQTLLIQYNIMNHALDFAEEMKGFDDVMDKLQHIEIDMSGLDDLSDIGNLDGDESPVNVDITAMLYNTKSTLEDSLNTEVAASVPIPIGLKQNNANANIVFDISLKGFDEISFKTGTLTIELEITPTSGNLNGTNFSFDRIQIEYGTTTIIGKSGGSERIEFSGGNWLHDIDFILSGHTLKKDFKIRLIGFNDAKQTVQNTVNLDIHAPDISEDTLVQGVINYEIKEEMDAPIEAYQIELDFGDNDFVHAEVGIGKIEFNIVMPNEKSTNGTWIELEKDPEMYMEILQAVINEEGTNWPGLSKLDSLIDGSGDENSPWIFDDTEAKKQNNLKDKNINSSLVDVSDNSKVILPVGGKMSFWLNDDDLSDKKVTAHFTPKIRIENFSLLHIKTGELLNVEIEPISLTDAAKYLIEIDFSKVGLGLDFGQIDIDGFKLSIVEENLDINTGPEPIVEPIVSNTYKEFVNTNKKLIVRDANDKENILVDELKFKVELTHDSMLLYGGKILTFEDVDVTEGKIIFDIKYKYFFEETWTDALVDFSQMNKDETFPVDGLSSINENLEGFKFKDIDSYLYIDGPGFLFDMDPDVDLIVEYEDKSKLPPSLYDGSEFPFERHPIPDLGDTGEYAKPKPDGNPRPLAEGTPINFKEILDDLPEGKIEIRYTVLLDKLQITRDEYKNLTKPGSSEMKVVAIVIMPMSLVAGEDGAIIKIPNMFEGSEDIFDRSTGGDDFSFLELIKRLTFKIGLNHNALADGVLYMRETNETPGEEVLQFKLSGTAMNIPITGEKLDVINKKNPYKIDDMGIRFGAGRELIIPGNLRMLSIGFDADISYGFDF